MPQIFPRKLFDYKPNTIVIFESLNNASGAAFEFKRSKKIDGNT